MDFLLGNEEIVEHMNNLPVKRPFSADIVSFCNDVSKELMKIVSGREYPDIITLGFWLRKSSVEMMKRRFARDGVIIRFGRGVLFHIAPSNVPINFAYSLFAGLLCGNANIVRLSSKEFPQVSIVMESIRKVLVLYPHIKSYLCMVRYEHEKEINDYLSLICDVRIIWGGDTTISSIRKSPLQSRATEVVFADRFSLAVIDVQEYSMLDHRGKTRIARGFYNDTYLMDQNACTSPRMIVWKFDAEIRDKVSEVRQEFWLKLWKIVEKEYQFQDIQGVNKLTRKYLLAADKETEISESTYIESSDNRLVAVRVNKITNSLLNYFDNSGFFLEYATMDILDLTALCNDNRCQTVGYVGSKKMLLPLLEKGVKGIDRIVPIGKAMDFDFMWDGYNLYEQFTRGVNIL